MRYAAALLALWLAGAPAWALQAFDAEYRLLFNDKPVARALFRLQQEGDGAYSFDAYTVPDGQVAAENARQEILEGSEGAAGPDGVVPSSYFYSVRDPSGTRLVEQIFDWAAGTLHTHAEEATRPGPLASGTQDRLSYLLRLAQAVASGADDLQFALAEPERTVQMRFRRHASERLELPAGTVEAVGIACFIDGDTPDRVIWFAPEWDHVPVLIERAVADGRVRMELLQRRGGPLPQ